MGTTYQELRGLVECGILTASRDGNRVYYQANPYCPIYQELLALVRKTSGLADVLRPALEALGNCVEVAFIYGSMARQEDRSGSDIDIMVIGDAGFGEVVSALADAQDALAREVNPSVYSSQEFSRKIKAGHHFLQAVMKEPKIFLIGDKDELRRLAT